MLALDLFKQGGLVVQLADELFLILPQLEDLPLDYFQLPLKVELLLRELLIF